MKPKIQILPEDLRGKIAAGEVIERPASVLKELIENAFDAGASEIKIEFSKGGLERIAIYDNGEGMSPEDLRLCYQSFATSKIKALSDLYHLKTYGFRGEALASIAQVSRLKILSRERGSSLSFEVFVEFGNERFFKPTHLKEGTLVEVKDLFENLPARKAFLKSIKTERAKNVEIIRALMLTHPEIRFFLKIDEEEVLSWKGGSLKELFSYLFEIPKENLVESSIKDGPYEVALLITDKTFTFTHGRFLYFFVNKRWIKDEKLTKLIYHLLRKFYGNLGLPAGVISIKVPPHLVDFNVHPAKWEVRFKREQDIYNLLERALTEHNRRQRGSYSQEIKVVREVVKEDLPLTYAKEIAHKNHRKLEKAPLFKEAVPSFKIIGSFLNTFILVEKEEELYVIDQHALAERIHYEELLSKIFLSAP
ncbi:MAG: DNA mismatch repair endonuclease MutL, partial [Caldimicrobium sp.]